MYSQWITLFDLFPSVGGRNHFNSILQVRKLRVKEVQSNGYSPCSKKGAGLALKPSLSDLHGCTLSISTSPHPPRQVVVWPWTGQFSSGGHSFITCECAVVNKMVSESQNVCMCGWARAWVCVRTRHVYCPGDSQSQFVLCRVTSSQPQLSSCSNVSWGLLKENNKSFPIYFLLFIEFINS